MLTGITCFSASLDQTNRTKTMTIEQMLRNLHDLAENTSISKPVAKTKK